MTTTASMPSTSIYETWLEHVEVNSILDDQPFNLDHVTEITLQLIDQLNDFIWLTGKMSTGEITIIQPGIIEFRFEKDIMGTLDPKNYQMVMLLEDATDTVALILGPVSITR